MKDLKIMIIKPENYCPQRFQDFSVEPNYRWLIEWCQEEPFLHSRIWGGRFSIQDSSIKTYCEIIWVVG